VDARPRLAEERQLVGRDPGRQAEQGEHHGHPDRDVRLRGPEDRLEPPELGPRRSTGTRAPSASA
jgi:hypothetical protein